MTTTPHGSEPRGLTNTPRTRSYDGRFGRMFGGLQPAFDSESAADDEILVAIASSMSEAAGPGADNPAIPAGYVYLGQFVDHDLTFDPVSSLQRRNDPEGLINFRSPRFDLDSVYGSGPRDEPFQYDTGEPHPGLRLLVQEEQGPPAPAGPDLPRNSQGVALIGDPRNDENGIVSQLHVAYLRLHNAFLTQVAEETGPAASAVDQFEEAQKRAQWHHQWVVAHDFLPRVIGDELHRRLLTTITDEDGNREVVRLAHYRHKVNPYLPVEFSGAAYRFGHSQVRDDYSINQSFQRPLFSPSATPVDGDFRGFQPLRRRWQASWPFFFGLDPAGPQASRAIDTSLAPSLNTLQGRGGQQADLPLLNLRRGAALGLPSGQSIAKAMGEDPLGDDELAPAPPGRAPLWFYVLREAALRADGKHLGPVGGRIVGETLLGLLRADPRSYLSMNPAWTPTLAAAGGDPRSFEMADLLRFAVPDQVVRF